jgi:large subunit ribosomal protein L18
MDKKSSRLRRARKTRGGIRRRGLNRLTVHRTPRHIYAQINSEDGSRTLVSVSTLQSTIAAEIKNTGNTEAAAVVGKAIAEKAIAAGIDKVAFDRSGFKYHGRIKALADAARNGGLKF